MTVCNVMFIIVIVSNVFLRPNQYESMTYKYNIKYNIFFTMYIRSKITIKKM